MSNQFQYLTFGCRISNGDDPTDIDYDVGTVIELYDTYCTVKWDGLDGDEISAYHTSDEFDPGGLRVTKEPPAILEPLVATAVAQNVDLAFFSAVSAGCCPCGLIKRSCDYHS